jgi:N12 class adenine-specific DNA methylase
MTVIVCPNDVVNQWEKNILEIFPDSKVITGKKHFIQNTIILGVVLLDIGDNIAYRHGLHFRC